MESCTVVYKLKNVRSTPFRTTALHVKCPLTTTENSRTRVSKPNKRYGNIQTYSYNGEVSHELEGALVCYHLALQTCPQSYLRT